MSDIKLGHLGYDPNTVICMLCRGKIGHTISTCEFATCDKCHERGHIEDNCWKYHGCGCGKFHSPEACKILNTCEKCNKFGHRKDTCNEKYCKHGQAFEKCPSCEMSTHGFQTDLCFLCCP